MITFTKKKVTPYVGKSLAVFVYSTLASSSDCPINFLCSANIFFSIPFTFAYDCGRNSFKLSKTS